ncbi:MAG: type I restriction enzyme endonuclease domain-containing protein [Prochlorococcaceae cyanobacterium]
MSDDKLKLIAAELITQVKKSVSIDWTLRESAHTRIRVMVKRILNKHGYPPRSTGRRGENRAGPGGATRAGYTFTGFPGKPECHLYLHHDGYHTGVA